MRPDEAINTMRTLSKHPQGLELYSQAVSTYVGQISHLLTPRESSELLKVCASSKLTIHAQGVLWLLQRASCDDVLVPRSSCFVVNAFVAAVNISNNSPYPFHVEPPVILHDSRFLASLSSEDVFQLAVALFQGGFHDKWDPTLERRLSFFTERGGYSNEQLHTLLQIPFGEEVHGACYQAVHRRLSELTSVDCVRFLDTMVMAATPPPVVLSALIQVLQNLPFDHFNVDSILSYYYSLMRICRLKGFGWLEPQVSGEYGRLVGLIGNEIDWVLEELDAQGFCALLSDFPPVNQSVFDKIQLKAFVMVDTLSCQQISSVMQYVVRSSQSSLLVAYPAVNRLKRRFYDEHTATLIRLAGSPVWCGGLETPLVQVESLLTSLVSFVNSIGEFPLISSDSSSLKRIHQMWCSPAKGGVSLFTSCPAPTQLALQQGLTKLAGIAPGIEGFIFE